MTSLSVIAGLLLLPAASASAASGSADLSLSGSVSPEEAAVGDDLTFGFSIHNEGPDPAVDVAFISVLPPGLIVASASTTSGSCLVSGSGVTCELGTLNRGSADVRVGIMAVAGNVSQDTSFDVSASVSAATPDPDDTNNELVVMSIVLAPTDTTTADLEVTSVLNEPNPVTGGYDLGSTAIVTNLGPDAATGVMLTDTLAPGESFVGASDPSCGATAGVVTCELGDMADGGVATLLIITKTPKAGADSTIHDIFQVTAAQDALPGNDTLDIATTVRAPRDDFVAGYVPPSPSTTWLSDATRWSHGHPVATVSDPTVALIGIPGGGPGGPVVVNELPCVAPFSCMALGRSRASHHPPRGVFGNLVRVDVPSGYATSRPITGVFLDNWSVLSSGWGSFDAWYQAGSIGTPRTLPSCGGWKHTGPPCVSSIARMFGWWNTYSFGDLRTVVRFTAGGTFGRGR